MTGKPLAANEHRAIKHLITIIADAMISSRLSAQARRVCEVMMARERDPFYSCPTHHPVDSLVIERF